jgi:hypothetical protein
VLFIYRIPRGRPLEHKEALSGRENGIQNP